MKAHFVDDFSAVGFQTFSQGTESYWPLIFSAKPTDSDFPQCYRFHWKQGKEDQYEVIFSGHLVLKKTQFEQQMFPFAMNGSRRGRGVDPKLRGAKRRESGRIKLGGETSASEQKGVMQWTGTLLRDVACFRLRSGLAMWFVH